MQPEDFKEARAKAEIDSKSCPICCPNSGPVYSPNGGFAVYIDGFYSNVTESWLDCYHRTSTTDGWLPGLSVTDPNIASIEMIPPGLMQINGLNVGETEWSTEPYTYWTFYDDGMDCYRTLEDLTISGPIAVVSAINFTTVINDVNNQSSSFSSGAGIQIANVNLGGGRQVCTGNRTAFNITVNFELPPGATSIYTDSRTFISDGATQQFQHLSFSFEDVSYSLGRGKMIINLRRVRPDETNNSIRITIRGGMQDGRSYTGTARVNFICP